MASRWDGTALLRLLSDDVDPDEASRRLLAYGADVDALAGLEAFVRALAADPSARDRALLLVERTRLLAGRAARDAQSSDRLRGEADVARRSDADDEEGLGGVWRHELSTPLSVTDLALETLANHRDDPALVTRMLEVARRNLRIAAQLLDGLGSLEDLRSGRIELAWTQVDLVELVHECADDIQGVLAGQHEIRVVVQHAVHVPADRQAVRQVLCNLLTNAAKFSPVDSVIDLRVSATPDHAEVAVRDRGRGLSPRDTERIFEAGGRLDPATPGSGLGLFVARQFARAHGGDLLVDHPSGEGSEFVLRLPRSPGAWQASLERREEAGAMRADRQRQRAATADERDDALARRESIADQRDDALADREAAADERDADIRRREGG